MQMGEFLNSNNTFDERMEWSEYRALEWMTR
jgi:hypothetical protein